MNYLRILLVFIPVSFLLEVFNFNPVWIFATSSLAIIPLAGLMGEATEGISSKAGQRVGGFLNATFGNATELIISFFALKEGLFEVVKASIAGSVIGNILLVLGASMFFGGMKHKIQEFNKNAVEVSSSMLLFSVIGLCLPAIFFNSVNQEELSKAGYENVSLTVAGFMLLIYILGLIFSFYTHKDVFGTIHEVAQETGWSAKKSILVLIITTIIIALESEFLVGSVESVTESFHISKFFIGIILIPIIGNAAEHSTAIIMAIKNKMDVAVEIAVGSSLQIILFVLPVLVFISLFFSPMHIVFNHYELSALAGAVLIANKVSNDGKSNWLEGIQLVTVYIIIAVVFWMV